MEPQLWILNSFLTANFHLFLCLDPSEHARDYEPDHKRSRRDLGGGRTASPPPSAYGGGDSRRIPLEKLAELERRVGLGGGEGGGGGPAQPGNGYQSARGRKEGWY